MTTLLHHMGRWAARCLTVVLVVASVHLVSEPAHAGPSEDAVREVGRLMAAQQWEEALEVAQNAPVREATRQSLIGLVAMRAGAHERAIQAFERALELGPPRERISLYLAWSHYALGEFEQARQALGKVKSEQARESFYWLLAGRIARDMGDASAAYDMLLEGHARFPEDLELTRELGFLLVEFGALYMARHFVMPLLVRPREDEPRAFAEIMALIGVLGERGEDAEALFYTELVRARFSDHAARIDAIAAHLYARAGQSVTAARLFVRASLRGQDSYAFEAADQYRVAQMTRDALEWNARVIDSERKLEQRFLILTEGGLWARAASIGRQLYRTGRLDEQRFGYRYGLALAIGLGDLEGARAMVESLGQSAQASQLSEIVTRCERGMEECR